MNAPMTDYYPLILKAIDALENKTGEARRTIYKYARSALIRQSRNKIPPLTEAELACERLALEQAILTVEAERVAAAGSRRPPMSGGPVNRLRSGTRLTVRAANTGSGAWIAAKPIVAEAEASARREPPPVSRREQAVPPRPTTSGVGAREVVNQPPSPTLPPYRRFRLFERRNQEVANYPGTPVLLDLGPHAAPVKRGDRSRLPAAILRVLGRRKPTVAPPTERPAAVPGRGLPLPHCDQPRHPPARPSEQAAPPRALTAPSAERELGGRALADRAKCVDRRSQAGHGYAAHPAGPTRV